MWDRLRRARRVLEENEEAYSSVPSRAAPSLARDGVIVMVEPDSGPLGHGSRADFVVAGALLVELSREGRITASGSAKNVRVTVRDTSPLGVRELDDALLGISSGVFGSKATRLISLLPQAHEMVTRLLAEGVLLEERRTRLGLVPVRRYHAAPSAGREELVAGLRRALLGESVPDERTALLVSVLSAAGNIKRCVPKRDFKEAKRRAEEIRERLGDAERALLSAVDVAATNAGSDYSSSA